MGLNPVEAGIHDVVLLVPVTFTVSVLVMYTWCQSVMC